MFKDTLKELREERELSQAQLAQKIKTSQSAVAKWELGQREPTAGNIVALARFFNVSSDFLLGLDDKLET